jgi:cytosine/adenosine deaminase-related metal-dependent hydrolase
MPKTLLIRNVRPMGQSPVDILIRDGRIAEISANVAADGIQVEDGKGLIALPGLVEAHTHLDKNLLGMGWRPHHKIETERRLKGQWDIDPQRQSARQVVLSVAKGTTVIRSHVDIDTEVGLSGLEGVCATRESYRDAVDIEIVAFPQSGLMSRPGTAELMETALKNGADVVGGLDPCSIDRDPKGQLDIIFGFAEKFGKPIDIHLHESGYISRSSQPHRAPCRLPPICARLA